LPYEIADFKCDKVYVEVTENNNLFVTRLTVLFKDCKNSLLFSSEEGMSREKEFSVAYNEVLRNAFKSFDKLNYKYNSEKYGDIYRSNIKAKSSDSVKKNELKDIGETTSNNS
jgi:hypothetical protein